MPTTALGLTSPLELLDELKRKVRALRRLQFQIVEIVGALESQGAAETLGYKYLIEVFNHTLRWDPKTSRRKLKQAQAVCPTVTPSGAPLEPVLPGIAAAIAGGELCEEHVEVLADEMAGLPAVAEEHVVSYARVYEPRAVKVFCKV